MRPHILLSTGLAAALLIGCSPDDGANPSTTGTTTPVPAPTPTPTPTPRPPSVAGLPAAALVARAEASLHEARAFRVHGTDRSEGQTTTIDMRFARTGSHGTISIDGAAIRLIVIGKTAYLKMSEKTWRSELPKRDADAVIELLRGRWLKAPTTHPDYKDMADFGSKTAMVRLLFAEAGPTFRKTAPKTIDGVRCIGLADRDGVLWVDVTNAHPVRIDATDGTGGSMTFSEFGTAAEPKAPPAELVLDVRKMER